VSTQASPCEPTSDSDCRSKCPVGAQTLARRRVPSTLYEPPKRPTNYPVRFGGAEEMPKCTNAKCRVSQTCSSADGGEQEFHGASTPGHERRLGSADTCVERRQFRWLHRRAHSWLACRPFGKRTGRGQFQVCHGDPCKAGRSGSRIRSSWYPCHRFERGP
jgi:hypothetical protein